MDSLQEAHDKEDSLHKLIPTLIDELSAASPDRLYGELPLSPTGCESGMRKVTYRTLANAINGLAWWITQTLGPSKGSFETLSYIGSNDMGHNIVLLGAIKAGYKILLVSPRYGTIGQARLMNETNCNQLLVSPAHPTGASQSEALTSEVPNLHVWTTPDLATLFDTQHAHFPYTKTYTQGKTDPLVVIHTSGTSGLPKPIIWTLEWALSFAAQRHLLPPAGYESLDSTVMNARVLSLMPPFHAGHLFASLLFTIYCGSTCIYPPADLAPNAQTAAYMARNVSIDTMWFLPAHIDEIGANPQLIDTISQCGVKNLFWAGGSVQEKSGEAIAQKMRLCTTCGSTETGMWPSIRRTGDWEPDTWRYMCFHPRAQIRFQEQGDGLFGAVFQRPRRLCREEGREEVEREGPVPPAFSIFTQDEEFDTKDLFRLHSRLDEYPCWTYHGRSDDLQVFQTGFKWHPVAAERRIVAESHGSIQEVLLIGTGRMEIVAICELAAEVQAQIDRLESENARRRKLDEVLDGVWSTIEDVNRSAPVYVNISRGRVVFTDSGRPMARTAKGNVQRKQTVAEYEGQIQKVLTGVHITQKPY